MRTTGSGSWVISWLALAGGGAAFAAPPVVPAKAPAVVPAKAPVASPAAVLGETKKVATATAPKLQPPTPIYSVAFSPDGKQVAVGGYKRVTLYEVETGKRAAQYVVGKDAVRTVAFSGDGKRLAAGSGVPAVGGTVAVIDAANGKPIRTLSAHTDTVEGVAFAGNLLLSAADDETVAITDLASGKNVGTLREHVGRCLSVTVPSKTSDGDGGNIFVTSGSDNMVKVWDADKRRVVVNFDQATAPVWTVAAFPRPGRFVAGSADGHLRWHNIYTERERSLPNGDKEPIVPLNGDPQPRGGYIERDIMAHEGGVYSVAPSPTDGFLVSGGADGKVVVWNLGGGKVREWADSKKDVVSVAVSPDGKRIAAASLDGHVRLYDAEKGTAMWQYPLPPADEPGAGGGLSASYWKNIDLSGEPFLRRIEGQVDFNTKTAAIKDVPLESMSARWEGFFEAPAAGRYTFVTRTDDGVRLWVEDKPVIDNWTGHAVTEDRAKEPIALKKGQRVRLKLDYFQGGGEGEVHLLAARDGGEPVLLPKDRLFPMPAPTKAAPAVTPKAAVPSPKPKP